ncbi:Ash-like/host cell division inhibitor Icd-like protein [Klebsiella variicola]|uniref:Putative CI repressor n=2 Tax=Klebsiella/Raoultella group TaxID=2890311 RepID=E5F8U9_KLEPN|nr:putative CI repressor [Klebsiella pneumoniae subsp. pneumoniae]MCI8157628.1 ash family protein [Klebsiella pneumoniae]PXJ81606.1 Ash-like/host cell division inhibitor Icd-like protein [Klebsiella variicola]QBD89797.1 host cell division inhibitor Icd-like protein [Klebsiella pneumoniae]RRF17040.1 host cell division inhibitor Icd-like protein [Klebsiella pneumoniae]
MMMPVPQKAPFSGLLPFAVSRYSFVAVAKSAAGRRNPSETKATPDAPCVFFCVCALVHPLFAHWFFSHCSIFIMVARAGQPPGWPVSFVAGIPTPVRATTHERRNSGGGCIQLTKEVAPMAMTLTPSHPQFVFVFAAVRRADRQPRICMLRAVAGDEHAARLSLVRDYVLSFAGRLPVAEVRA